jgi:UrcA family protein
MITANLHHRSSRRMGLRIAAMAAGIVAAAATGVSAAATPAADAPSVVVHYADLNLATEQGARVLYRRIAIAAWNVCPDAGNRDLQALAERRACREQAIARAVRDVGTPLLAAVYADHRKHS